MADLSLLNSHHHPSNNSSSNNSNSNTGIEKDKEEKKKNNAPRDNKNTAALPNNSIHVWTQKAINAVIVEVAVTEKLGSNKDMDATTKLSNDVENKSNDKSFIASICTIGHMIDAD